MQRLMRLIEGSALRAGRRTAIELALEEALTMQLSGNRMDPEKWFSSLPL